MNLKIIFGLMFGIILITSSISYQQATAGGQIVISNTVSDTKESTVTITSSSSFKLTDQKTIPSTVTLPNSTNVLISKVGYVQFPDKTMFILTRDNFIQYANGSIKAEVPHMDNLPPGATYLQKPAWMDNLPNGTIIVSPP